MRHLSRELIEELLTKENHKLLSVTIYMPTHPSPTPPHMHEDQIRFKNLNNQALEILDKRKAPSDIVQFAQEQFEKLRDDKTFWENQTEGLLLCVRPGLVKYFNLPVACDEYVSVDDHFHLAPVYALLSDNQSYYLLVLAEHNPALYKGDMHELKSVGLRMPESLEDALNLDEINQFHVNGGSSGGQFHGQGGVRDIGGEERLKYFRIIDGRICSQQQKDIPLIIAATEEEYVAYKNISKYPLVMEAFINGNHTKTSPDELLSQAWQIIERKVISPRKVAVVSRFKELIGRAPQLASSSIASLKDAAEKGRIDTLIIAMLKNTRDTIQDGKGLVQKIVFPELDICKPLDYLAQQVWSQRGKIYVVSEDTLPPNSPFVAIYRY